MGDPGGGAPVEVDSAHLAAIDEALIALRHLWTTPPRLADPVLGDVDVSTVLVVHVLSARPATDGPASVGDVARGLDIAHSTASRLVDRAVRTGVVARTTSPVDGRRVTLQLTPAGARLAVASRRFRTGYLRVLLADWSDREAADFARLLHRFADAVRHHPPREDPP